MGGKGLLLYGIDFTKKISLAAYRATPLHHSIIILFIIILEHLEWPAIKRLTYIGRMRDKAVGNNMMVVTELQELMGKVRTMIIH